MTKNPEFGDKYRLIWRKQRDEKVAEVRNYTLDEKGYRRINILLDDQLMKRIKMRFLASQNGTAQVQRYTSVTSL